jgi:hypothetical protein
VRPAAWCSRRPRADVPASSRQPRRSRCWVHNSGVVMAGDRGAPDRAPAAYRPSQNLNEHQAVIAGDVLAVGDVEVEIGCAEGIHLRLPGLCRNLHRYNGSVPHLDYFAQCSHIRCRGILHRRAVGMARALKTLTGTAVAYTALVLAKKVN